MWSADSAFLRSGAVYIRKRLATSMGQTRSHYYDQFAIGNLDLLNLLFLFEILFCKKLLDFKLFVVK